MFLIHYSAVHVRSWPHLYNVWVFSWGSMDAQEPSAIEKRVYFQHLFNIVLLGFKLVLGLSLGRFGTACGRS